MKSLLVLALIATSTATFAQTKAKSEVLPASVQAHDAKAKKKLDTKTAEAPCDTKDDVLKKLEEKKKESALTGKGLSLQGATDSGCTLK